eukprot:6478926-Amphidinium_carterae.1
MQLDPLQDGVDLPQPRAAIAISATCLLCRQLSRDHQYSATAPNTAWLKTWAFTVQAHIDMLFCSTSRAFWPEGLAIARNGLQAFDYSSAILWCSVTVHYSHRSLVRSGHHRSDRLTRLGLNVWHSA